MRSVELVLQKLRGGTELEYADAEKIIQKALEVMRMIPNVQPVEIPQHKDGRLTIVGDNLRTNVDT